MGWEGRFVTESKDITEPQLFVDEQDTLITLVVCAKILNVDPATVSI